MKRDITKIILVSSFRANAKTMNPTPIAAKTPKYKDPAWNNHPINVHSITRSIKPRTTRCFVISSCDTPFSKIMNL